MSEPRRGLMRWLPWRTALVLVAVYVVMELWIVDTIPVTTGSMEPYLHGAVEGGDHVVVAKVAFWGGREPERFDPVVVRIPDDAGGETYFIKRVVAFGGEEVRIQHGDLLVSPSAEQPPQIVRKDYEQFDALLVDFYDESFDELPPRMTIPEGPARVENGDLLLAAQAAESSGLCTIDGGIDSGFIDVDGERQTGEHVVGDLLVEVHITPESDDAVFILELFHGHDSFFYRIPVRAGSRVEVIHTQVEERTYGVPYDGCEVGRAHRLELWQIDERVGIAIDGQVVLSENHAPVKRVVGDPSFAPRFGCETGSVRIHGLRLRRDLHYVSRSDEPVRVPPGELFLLGDHSEASRDSRQFGCVAEDRLVGRPVAVLWPWARARWLR